MKPVSHLLFSRKYPISDPSSLVTEGNKLWLSDDVYIKRGIHRQRTYNYNTDVGPTRPYIEIPVFKLISKEYINYRLVAGKSENALAVWSDSRVYTVRCESINKYANFLVPRTKTSRWWDNKCLFDALYYHFNDIQMTYNDGRLKSGFKNHFIRRIKGFAEYSHATQTMLDKAIEYFKPKQNELFNNEQLIADLNEFLSNDDFRTELHQCPFSKEINTTNQFNTSRVSGKALKYSYGIDLKDYGYTYCNDSHNYLLDDEIIIDGMCYNKDTVEITNCEDCNSRCVVQDTRDGLCVNCLNDSYHVQNYSMRVENELGFDKHTLKRKSDPYLGIEMEFQVDKRKQGRLYVGDNLAGHAMMKEDGSISDGFEVVSRPASYLSHLHNYDSFLTNLPEYIHPHKSCGMHVHISRTAFTTMGAGKFVEFMNRADNKSFIKLIAGRGTTNYQNGDPDYTIKKPFRIAKRGEYCNRYNFVNLGNSKTIELRIFATPANKKEFHIRMQFVKAMVDYCKPAIHAVPYKQQTHFESFVSWLNNTKEEFKDLQNLIKESTICA
jgi:hypothetical protein